MGYMGLHDNEKYAFTSAMTSANQLMRIALLQVYLECGFSLCERLAMHKPAVYLVPGCCFQICLMPRAALPLPLVLLSRQITCISAQL